MSSKRQKAPVTVFSVCILITADLFQGNAVAQSSAVRGPDQVTGEVRGVTRAAASATISAEIVARILSIPFKPGQSFKAGAALVTFDCKRYDADLRAAEADAKYHEILVQTNQHLLRHRATGANELALSEAKLAQATAAAESLRVRTQQCTIFAPYDGHVVDRSVDIFDMPQTNAPLLRIVQDGKFEIDLIVPSRWSVRLKPGDRFTFHVEETGTAHLATIQTLGAAVDPVSRTIRILARFENEATGVKPGMSGFARLQPDTGENRP